MRVRCEVQLGVEAREGRGVQPAAIRRAALILQTPPLQGARHHRQRQVPGRHQGRCLDPSEYRIFKSRPPFICFCISVLYSFVCSSDLFERLHYWFIRFILSSVRCRFVRGKLFFGKWLMFTEPNSS